MIMRKKISTKSISAVISENYTLTLYDIEVCEWMSDETLAMHAKVALNGAFKLHTVSMAANNNVILLIVV